MHGTSSLDQSLSRQSFEKRTETRVAIALPILISLGRTRYSALLRNLSNAGAMIETSTLLTVQGKIEFHCGSIFDDSTVLWRSGSRFGIRFGFPITDRQLNEQISRSEAVKSWREGRIPAEAKNCAAENFPEKC